METFQDIISGSRPVLVDFYADWCGPCKAMSPVIQELAREMNGQFRVLKVDIDKAQVAAQHFNVQAVPTFIIFRNGQVVWRHSGMIDKQSLLHNLQTSS